MEEISVLQMAIEVVTKRRIGYHERYRSAQENKRSAGVIYWAKEMFRCDDAIRYLNTEINNMSQSRGKFEVEAGF
jgi:hypothetical protein